MASVIPFEWHRDFDYGDVLFMPALSSPLTGSTNQYSTSFSHEDESESWFHHSVKLANKIIAELTTTTRVGFHRYIPRSIIERSILDEASRQSPRLLPAHVDKTHIEGFPSL